ncbi:E3 binding domain-containing protein [Leptolyngbya sp. 15MV]|nr:E3 binding domain-containing protein [Leptolyngbya sp. 15MV]
MAKFTFKMPDIGEGIAEAEIVAWHVKVGDRVEEDQEIVDMMTDKATVPMESPVSGTVVEVAGGEGDMVAIGSMLVVVEIEGEGEASAEELVRERIEVENPDAGDADDAIAAGAARGPSTSSGRADVGDGPNSETLTEAQPAPTSAQPEPVGSEAGPEGQRHAPTHAKVLATPAVRQRARDLGIDLAQVNPAEDGRIRHADLDAFLSYNGGSGYAAPGKPRADEAIKVIGLRAPPAAPMAPPDSARCWPRLMPSQAASGRTSASAMAERPRMRVMVMSNLLLIQCQRPPLGRLVVAMKGRRRGACSLQRHEAASRFDAHDHRFVTRREAPLPPLPFFGS